ncbi:MAG TPA: DUF420 domain-containing protein [Myxococcota bacterium]|nr:DUF420 domain-containing protein [Myxococcota bacterium]
MDGRLLYWTAAFANMLLIVVLGLLGVRAVRRGRVRQHRRCMLVASGLVIGFLGSYLLKVALLGREELERWDAASVIVLRIHELCVFTMLLGGIAAASRAFAMRRDPIVRGTPTSLPRDSGLRMWHRRAGWTALTGALLGVVTAALVLAGMYGRA